MNDVALLFLHGINDTGDAPWDVTLRQGLRDAGFNGWGSVGVIAPDYYPELARHRIGRSPRRTYTRPPEKIHARLAADYRVSQTRLAGALGITDPAEDGPRPGLSTTRAAGLRTKRGQQALNYLQHEEVREAVRHQVLTQLPRTGGRLLILAHSLGTLVALDLLHYLPKGTQVPLLVTVASPCHHARFFQVITEPKRHYEFPYGLVDGWVNVFNPWDVVAGGRGLTSRIPQALDYVRPVGTSHSLSDHLDDAGLSNVIGETLFEPRAAAAFGEPRESLPPEAVFPILLSQFALRIEERLRQADRSQDLARRYAAARTEVARRARESQETTSQLGPFASLLGTDTSTLLTNALCSDDALLVDVGILAVTANPVSPFEIHVPDKIHDEARRKLERDIGLRAGDLSKARQCVVDAQKALPARRKLRPVMVGVGVLGVAAAIAAPLVLAAGIVGVPFAGGAAIAAGLAAFGPGGMVGGLLTLGLTVGGGSALGTSALGQALSQTPPAAFRQAAVELLARASLGRHLGSPEAGKKEWDVLSVALAESQRELHMHEGISDDKSPRVLELKENVRTGESALDWLTEQGFGPGVPQLSPED